MVSLVFEFAVDSHDRCILVHGACIFATGQAEPYRRLRIVCVGRRDWRLSRGRRGLRADALDTEKTAGQNNASNDNVLDHANSPAEATVVVNSAATGRTIRSFATTIRMSSTVQRESSLWVPSWGGGR